MVIDAKSAERGRAGRGGGLRLRRHERGPGALWPAAPRPRAGDPGGALPPRGGRPRGWTGEGRGAGTTGDVAFSPHLAPMTRGLLATCYARPTRALTTADVISAGREFYAGEAFVWVVEASEGRGVHSKWTAGSTLAFVSYVVNPRTGLVVALGTADHLGKARRGRRAERQPDDRAAGDRRSGGVAALSVGIRSWTHPAGSGGGGRPRGFRGRAGRRSAPRGRGRRGCRGWRRRPSRRWGVDHPEGPEGHLDSQRGERVGGLNHRRAHLPQGVAGDQQAGDDADPHHRLAPDGHAHLLDHPGDVGHGRR